MAALDSLLAFLALFQFFLPIMTAEPIVNAPGGLGTPHNPFQQHVRDTSITLIIKYHSPPILIPEVKFLHIAFMAHYDIIKALTTAPASDHIIHTPNLQWFRGKPYMSGNSRALELTWEMLAHALTGIQDFYDNWGYMQLTARVLDKDAGYVGDVVVGANYNLAEIANLTVT